MISSARLLSRFQLKRMNQRELSFGFSVGRDSKDGDEPRGGEAAFQAALRQRSRGPHHPVSCPQVWVMSTNEVF